MVSYANATHLEKANLMLDKVVEHAMQNDNAFLKHEGIFRLAGSKDDVDKVYAKYAAEPSELVIDKEPEFIKDHNNIVDYLKRFIRTNNLGWSDEASEILKNELMEQGEIFEYEEVIKVLIAKNHLEEAKMLHNVLHLMRLVSLQSEKNKMNPSNLSIVMGPWIVEYMAKVDNPLDALTIGSNKSNKSDPIKLSSFEQNFDQKYPEVAQKLAERHAEIPTREVKSVAKISPAASLGSQILARFSVISNLIPKTPLPAIINFFTKTIPSWIGRLIGKKAVGVEKRKGLADAELLSQIAARNKEATSFKPGTQPAERNSDVVMGSQAKGPSPDEAPPRPPRNNDTRVRTQLHSTKINPEEQTMIKETRDKALAFFKDLEQKGKDALPKRDKPKNKG